MEAVGSVSADLRGRLFIPPAAAGDRPPSDHLYASAVWLARRHPTLLQLADRAGVLVEDEEGDVVLQLDELADALNALDDYFRAWAAYERSHYLRTDATDAEIRAYEDAGPKHTDPRAPAIGPMSRTEVTRLRLLAFFAGDRIALRAGDLYGLDSEGQELLADWCRAVYAA
jgi:hypothetical protein